MLSIGAEPAYAGSSKPPLKLKEIGSNVYGGSIVTSDAPAGVPNGGGITLSGNEGRIATNQMYTRYMIPDGRIKVPVVLIQGGNLSGSC